MILRAKLLSVSLALRHTCTWFNLRVIQAFLWGSWRVSKEHILGQNCSLNLDHWKINWLMVTSWFMNRTPVYPFKPIREKAIAIYTIRSKAGVTSRDGKYNWKGKWNIAKHNNQHPMVKKLNLEKQTQNRIKQLMKMPKILFEPNSLCSFLLHPRSKIHSVPCIKRSAYQIM